MSKRKPIGRKIESVKTYKGQEIVLTEWIENWQEDQKNTIFKLRLAAHRDDHSEIMHMISQLEGMTEKRFAALKNVAKKVSDPNRELRNN